jgi:hypothetical protein
MPVNSTHPKYNRFTEKWQRCQDTYDGQDAIHQAGVRYLPMLIDQPAAAYDAYKGRTPFYNATYRTIVGLVGMVFRRPPHVEVPPAIKEMLKDVTLSNKPLQVFGQDISTEALKKGRVGIFVDCPEVRQPQNGYATLADQLTQNVRPSLLMYVAESIINWKTDKINNKVVLSMVVLKEDVSVSKDAFEDDVQETWRVLDLIGGRYRVRLFKRREKSTRPAAATPAAGAGPAGPVAPAPVLSPNADIGDFDQIGTDVFPLMGGKAMTYIPFVFIGAEGLDADPTDPPLIDLVDMNLSHYRTMADYEHGAHFTGLPTPYIAGYRPDDPKEKLYVGSASAWNFPDPNTKVGYLEFSGSGLTTLREILDRKETQMAILGARMLEPQKKQSETAESKEIHRKGEESMLSMISQTVSMGIEIALKWFSEWAGANPKGVVYEQNTDFFPAPMDAGMLSAIVSAWQQGAVSDRTLHENLQRGGVVPESRTFEEEQNNIQEGARRMAALAALTEPDPASDDEDDPPGGEGEGGPPRFGGA